VNTLALTDLTQVVFWTSTFAFLSGLLCMWVYLRGQRRECRCGHTRCTWCGSRLIVDMNERVAPGGALKWVCPRRCDGSER